MADMILIKSLTAQYDSMEDRIRVYLNYQDIEQRLDLMITRSMVVKFLFHMDEFVQNYLSVPEVTQKNSSTQTTSKRSSNKAKDIPVSTKNMSKTKKEDIELYRGKEDLLVNIQAKYDKQRALSTLLFSTKESMQAKLVADDTQLRQVLWSIKRAVPTYEWGVNLS